MQRSLSLDCLHQSSATCSSVSTMDWTGLDWTVKSLYWSIDQFRIFVKFYRNETALIQYRYWVDLNTIHWLDVRKKAQIEQTKTSHPAQTSSVFTAAVILLHLLCLKVHCCCPVEAFRCLVFCCFFSLLLKMTPTSISPHWYRKQSESIQVMRTHTHTFT